jgi:hypothetical protein
VILPQGSDSMAGYQEESKGGIIGSVAIIKYKVMVFSPYVLGVWGWCDR